MSGTSKPEFPKIEQARLPESHHHISKLSAGLTRRTRRISVRQQIIFSLESTLHHPIRN
jgi:hypothetical protein